MFNSLYKKQELFNDEICKETSLLHSDTLTSITKFEVIIIKVKRILHITFYRIWCQQLYSCPGLEGGDGWFICTWEIDHRLEIKFYLMKWSHNIKWQTILFNEVMNNELIVPK